MLILIGNELRFRFGVFLRFGVEENAAVLVGSDFRFLFPFDFRALGVDEYVAVTRFGRGVQECDVITRFARGVEVEHFVLLVR